MTGRRRAERGAGWRGRGAFTFFEIALSLALIAIVFLALIPVIGASIQERRMRRTMDDLVFLVADQRLAAERSGEELRLIFDKKGLGQRNPETGRPEIILAAPEEGDWQVRFPGGKWAKPDGQEWRFFPAGMVTPLSVRLEEGDAWIETDFDFLTGRVAEERYAF